MQKVIQQLQGRLKTVVAGLGGVLLLLQELNQVRPNHWLSLAIVALTTLGVHQAANRG